MKQTIQHSSNYTNLGYNFPLRKVCGEFNSNNIKFRFMNKVASIILLVIFGFAGACSDPYESDITPAYDELPVVGVLESEPDRFSMWVDLLKTAGLYSTMNLKANYTCFVPENEAISQYLAAKQYSSVSAIPVEEAKHLVKYHTIAGTQYTQSLFSNGVIPDTTATGDFISIEMRMGGLEAIYVNGEARISQLDISATNGVIHSIEKVLNPVMETIWDKLNQSQYSIFKKAVELTGYNQDLNVVNYTELNPETGVYQSKRRFYSCFAVSDATYKKEGVEDITQLTTLLGAEDNDYTEKTNPLKQYVAYHLLDQQLDFSVLATFSDESKSKNISTLAQNELINFSQRGDSLVINYDEETKGLSILESNINTKNGVMHEVNGIMPIAVPPITTVTWELTDYSDISALFPSNYRQAGLTSTFNESIKVGDVTCYEWEAIPSDRNNSAVSYYVANKNNKVPWGMMNHDCLVFRGGLYGWIQMESPAIVKGTYTMKVRYYSINSATRYGKFLTILDGKYLGSEIATHGSSSTTAQLQTTTIGKVTFEETSTHIVRLLASDDSAIYIDYIEFVPVK